MPAISGAENRAARLDALGLFLAGLINTFLAALDATLVYGPGTAVRQPELLARAAWIAENPARWGGGWLFWFAVTLSFAWSYYALGRNLGPGEGRTGGGRPWPANAWRGLAIGLAMIAAAVDIVGVLVNLVVLPHLAGVLQAGPITAILVMFEVMEKLAYALVNVSAFGLYSLAGLVLLPALFATPDYPRWLVWLGAAEWSVAALAAVLMVAAPAMATIPLLVSFGLYAPWVWAGAWWVWRKRRY